LYWQPLYTLSKSFLNLQIPLNAAVVTEKDFGMMREEKKNVTGAGVLAAFHEIQDCSIFTVINRSVKIGWFKVTNLSTKPISLIIKSVMII
jgi:hypothetical protein